MGEAAAGARGLVRVLVSVAAASALVVGSMGPAAAEDVVNQPPVVVADSGEMYSGSRLVVDAAGNDTDPEGGALTLVSVTPPAAEVGSAVIEAGKVVVRSAAAYVGPLVVGYLVADAQGAQAEGTITINVVAPPPPPPNAAPVAVGDRGTVVAGTSKSFTVLGNDSDPDGDRIGLVRVDPPKHGIAHTDGAKVRYRSQASYSGLDWIRYTIRDEHGATDTAVLTIRVTRSVAVTRVGVERSLKRLGLPGGTVDGVFTAATRRAVCAWRTVTGRTAHRGLPTASESRAIIYTASLPKARSWMVTGVNISRTCQTAFWVGQSRQYRRVMAACTGMPGYQTRVGTFRIFRTYHTWRWSTLYPEARMYKPMQFSGGQAIHGSATDSLVKTYPASHGCVRMFHRDIDALQAGGVGNGTLVKVFGNY